MLVDKCVKRVGMVLLGAILPLCFLLEVKSTGIGMKKDDAVQQYDLTELDSMMLLEMEGQDGMKALAMYHGDSKGSLPYDDVITVEMVQNGVKEYKHLNTFLWQKKTQVCSRDGSGRRNLTTLYLNSLPYDIERRMWKEVMDVEPGSWQQKVVDQVALDGFVLLETEQYPFYVTEGGVKAVALFHPGLHGVIYHSGAEKSLPHELGHYSAWYLKMNHYGDFDENEEIEQIWQQERDESYAGTDTLEWYAEAFAILFENDHDSVLSLQKGCPQTYEYVLNGIRLLVEDIQKKQELNITSLTVGSY